MLKQCCGRVLMHIETLLYLCHDSRCPRNHNLPLIIAYKYSEQLGSGCGAVGRATRVRIQSSATFIEHLFTVNC